MPDFLPMILGGMAGAAIWYLRAIFLEVRSIRRMMNADRKIANEVLAYDD